MVLPESLPYEVIGKLTVALIGIIAIITVLVVSLLLAYAIWWRGWTKLSNRMWKGYIRGDEQPPLWKIRVSGICLAIRNIDPHKIPDIWKEAEEMSVKDHAEKAYNS